jgi:hypothetical protein
MVCRRSRWGTAPVHILARLMRSDALSCPDRLYDLDKCVTAPSLILPPRIRDAYAPPDRNVRLRLRNSFLILA